MASPETRPRQRTRVLRRALRWSLLLAGIVGLAAPVGAAQDGSPAGTAKKAQVLASLTEEERSWLRDHPVITTANDPGWPPIEFTDARGQHAGMTADYLRLIEQRLGLKFTRVPDLNWQELYARHKRRELDLATCVAVTPPRLELWAFTKPYLTVPVVIATRTDVPYIADMKELVGKKVALPEGYAVDHWITADWPGIHLIRVSSAEAGLTLLQQGEVFAFIDGLLIIGDYQAKLKVTNIKIAGQTPYAYPLAMAVRKDWAPLVGILNKAMDSISESERAAIYRKWLPVRYEQGFDYALFWKVLAGFAVILLALTIWNRRLVREITHRKQAEVALRDSQSLYQDLVETSQDLIWQCDAEGRYIYLNPAWEGVFGYPLDEMLGRPFSDFQSPEDAARDAREFARLLRGGSVKGYEAVHRARDGRNLHLVFNAKTVSDQAGRHVGTRGTAYDITERRRAEESRRQANLVVENGPAVLFRWQATEGWPVSLVSENVRQFGYTPEELISGAVKYVAMVHPEDRARVVREVQEFSARGADRFQQEYRLVSRDGGERWVDDRTSVERDAGGRITCYQGIVLDISERKKAEAALRESEETFRKLYEDSPDPILLMEGKRFIRCNSATLRFLDIADASRFLGSDLADVSPERQPDGRLSAQAAPEYIAKAHAEGFCRFEWLCKTYSDVPLLLDVTLMPITLRGELLLHVTWRDITERQRLEREREEARALFDAAIAQSPSGILVASAPDVTIRWANSAARGIRGETDQPLTGIDVTRHASRWQTLRPDGTPYPSEELPLSRAVLKGEVTRDEEVLIRNARGDDRWVSVNAAPIRDHAGQVTAGIVVFHDITERRQAEAALREKTEELDRFFTTTLDLLCVADTDGRFRRLNPQWEAVLGYPVAELEGRRFLDLIHPDDVEATVQAVSRLEAQQPVLNFVNRYRCKDGSYRWFEWRSSPQGTLIYAAARDITESKRVEEALRQSEATYREIFNTVNDAIWIHDIDTFDFIDANSKAAEMFGYSVSEAVGLTVGDISSNISPFTPKTAAVYMRKAAAGEPQLFDWQGRHKDGHLLWTEVNLKRGTIAGRECLLAIERDITERKRAEEALRTSEQRYASIIAATNEGVFDWDSEGSVTHATDRWFDLYGLPRGTTPSMEAWRSTILPEDLARVDQSLQDCLQGKTHIAECEYRIQGVPGAERWLRGRALAACDPEGKPLRLYGTVADITERKRAEEALRESETRFRHVVEYSPMPIGISDSSGRIEYINPRFHEAFGYTLEEVAELEDWFQRAYPDLEYRQRVIAQWQEAMEKAAREQRPSEVVDVHITCRDGSVRVMQVYGTMMGDRLLAVFHDLTERVQAEAALRESEQRFAVFMENLPAGAFMKDGPGTVVYANRYLCDLFGWGSVIGRSTRELLPPELAEKMEAEDRVALAQGLLTVTEEIRDVVNRERVFQTSKFPIARAGRAPLLGGIAVDITERTRAEEALRGSLAEKEVLLKEVHHRVKNNLQIVSSLLNLQAREVRNPELKVFLHDTQGRIRAMSLLHETLYGSDNLARVSFRDYVQAVCAQVSRAYASDTRSVRFRQDVAEVMLPLDQAIPAGLILNELLSNALKHAFAGRAEGQIAVTLQVDDEQHYALNVADDGVGLPADARARDSETLGLRLVETLVRQLEGKLTVDRDAGTVFRIRFPRVGS